MYGFGQACKKDTVRELHHFRILELFVFADSLRFGGLDPALACKGETVEYFQLFREFCRTFVNGPYCVIHSDVITRIIFTGQPVIFIPSRI